MWSLNYELWSMNYEVWSLTYKVFRISLYIFSHFRKLGSVQCELWSMNCELWSVKSELWTMKSPLVFRSFVLNSLWTFVKDIWQEKRLQNPWLRMNCSWTVNEVNYLNHTLFLELNVNTASSNFCHKNVYQATFPYFWWTLPQSEDSNYHRFRTFWYLSKSIWKKTKWYGWHIVESTLIAI